MKKIEIVECPTCHKKMKVGNNWWSFWHCDKFHRCYKNIVEGYDAKNVKDWGNPPWSQLPIDCMEEK